MLQNSSTSTEVKSSSELHFKKIAKENIFQVLELQQIVLDALPEEKKSFIVPKSENDFHKNMSKPNFGLGLFNKENDLVGMAFLLAPITNSGLCGLTKCNTTDQLSQEFFGESVGVVCTVMLLPSYRKKGHMGKMLEQLHTVAIASGLDVLVSEVAVDNDASSHGFTHHGYTISGFDRDPSDDTRLLFMEQRLTPTRQQQCAHNTKPSVKPAAAYTL